MSLFVLQTQKGPPRALKSAGPPILSPSLRSRQSASETNTLNKEIRAVNIRGW